MSDVDKAIITPIENIILKIPGGQSPIGRTMIGAAVGGAITFGLKPGIMFNPDGSPRPWIILDTKTGNNPTVFPWYLGVTLPAILLGLFI